MKILYGTGNQAKLAHMRERLKVLDIEIIGLEDVKTVKSMQLPQIHESGNDPLENAIIKAEAYYKMFHMPVFSCDSGLYFPQLHEKVQPGVHVRNVNGKYLSDEEMIAHYSGLAKKHGDILARYKNAICLIVDEKTRYTSMRDDLSGESFIITNKPHSRREKGFPLDSLSKHIATDRYYYDFENYKVDEVALDNGFVKFFEEII
jgi:XTP/dITP diphosphohydrolase